MKYLLAFIMLISLVACDATNVDTQTNTTNTEVSTTGTNETLNSELDNLEIEEENIDNDKVVTLDASYTNPEGTEVPLEITYSLDNEDKIESINIEGYSHNGFIEAAEQEVIGKTVEEASNLYVAGASLSTEAFQKAMKSSL